MKVNIKKLAVSAMLTAVAVSLSGFSIPIGASKCFPTGKNGCSSPLYV